MKFDVNSVFFKPMTRPTFCTTVSERVYIADKIKRGVRNGELPPSTNAAALSKFYMTVMQGMTIQARDGATQEELLAVARAAMLQWPKFARE